MKKQYLVLAVGVLVGLQVVLSHADVLKQSLKQITLPSIVGAQVTDVQVNEGLVSDEQINDEQQQEITFSPIELSALVQQKCWSARKCKGKVLNNLNAHECKNSGGKSWNDNQGLCIKL